MSSFETILLERVGEIARRVRKFQLVMGENAIRTARHRIHSSALASSPSPLSSLFSTVQCSRIRRK